MVENKEYNEKLEIIEDEIVSIEEYESMDTIDIELDSENRLFFANDILTHNSGWDGSDIVTTDVAESAALIHTVDGLFGIITNPEMKANGEYRLKYLADRVSGMENTRKKFSVDWTYGRIEEDKNSPIEDTNSIYSVLNKKDRKPANSSHTYRGSTINFNSKENSKENETEVSDVDFTGSELFK